MSHPNKASIVIVDDTPDNLRLLATMLSDEGYRVRPSPNGEHALATVEKEIPDMILLDILMPRMDGYEVCRRLKADERFSHIPVIFISALNDVFDKVTAFTIGAVDYITKPFQVEEVLARVQTHLSIEEMRQTLALQNSELEAFAHTVAHDLKNPLSIILGSLDLVQESELNLDTQSHELLNLGIMNAHKMHSIIEELLLLSSVRKGQVTTGPVDMQIIMDQVLFRLARMCEQYNAQVILPASWHSAVGYAPWIEEVFMNYISNGLKYGGQPPRLELFSEALPNGTIRFCVVDNGAGLDEQAQASLFTEFTRLDQIRAEGHGLGLSIVRRIMDKLQGDFGVISTPGEGSLFYFSLPESED